MEISLTTRNFTFDIESHDDIAIRPQPTRHVDYLSHNWREEDLSSSWKYIVSQRSHYSNGERLENALWRMWLKARQNLMTAAPEILNWHKDCDITWLYGPIQTHNDIFPQNCTVQQGRAVSKNSSFKKKPILKKRTISETLERSLRRPGLSRHSKWRTGSAAGGWIGQQSSVRRLITSLFTSRRPSGDGRILASSRASFVIASPSSMSKHVLFKEQVEQCIAIEFNRDEPNKNDTDWDWYDSSGSVWQETEVPLRKESAASGLTENKMIAVLSPTALK